MSANPQYTPEPHERSDEGARTGRKVGVYNRPRPSYAKWVLLAVLAIILLIVLRFVF